MTDYKQLFYLIEQSLKLDPQFCDGWHADKFKVANLIVSNIRQQLGILTVRQQRYNQIRLNISQSQSSLMKPIYSSDDKRKKDNQKTLQYIPKETQSEIFTRTHNEFWEVYDILNKNPKKTINEIIEGNNYRKYIVLGVSLIQKMDMLDEVGSMPLSPLIRKAEAKRYIMNIAKRNKKKSQVVIKDKTSQKGKQRSPEHQCYIEIFCDKFKTMSMNEIYEKYKIPKSFMTRLNQVIKNGGLLDLLNSKLTVYHFYKNISSTPKTRKHRKKEK